MRLQKLLALPNTELHFWLQIWLLINSCLTAAQHATRAQYGQCLQARFDVDAKRTKLAKLRGTAGIKVSTLTTCCEYVLVYSHRQWSYYSH